MNIYDLGVKYVAARSRTAAEVRRYLGDKGFEAGEIEELIRDFTDYGYIDDCRYAADFAAYGADKGWSDRRILAELEKRGVCREAGQDALAERREEDGEQEETRAFYVALSVIRGAEITDRKDLTEKVKGRIGRRLASYGYSAGVFYDVLRRLEKYLEEER